MFCNTFLSPADMTKLHIQFLHKVLYSVQLVRTYYYCNCCDRVCVRIMLKFISERYLQKVFEIGFNYKVN